MSTFVTLLFLFCFVGLPVWHVLRKRNLKTDMLAAAGLQDGQGYTFFFGDSGIVLNPATKCVTVAEKWRMKTYPFSDIRSWKASKVHAGPTHVTAFGGASGAAQNVGNALRAKAHADSLSHFVLVVKDIDAPEWKIRMIREKDQARWMEILQQEINEA